MAATGALVRRERALPVNELSRDRSDLTFCLRSKAGERKGKTGGPTEGTCTGAEAVEDKI